MPTLITTQYVKDNFEPWQSYCTVTGSAFTPTQILDMKIDLAETEFLEYITVDTTTVNSQHKRHILTITKKNCFDIKHGSTDFDQKPLIVKEYDATIKLLQKYRAGEIAPWDKDSDTTNDKKRVSITAKTRRFDKWFNDESET